MFVPLISNGHARPSDLDTSAWTLDDVCEYNEALAVRYDNERRMSDHAANAARSGSRHPARP